MISVCIFGSQARKTADDLSDRDVLLIGSSSASLDRAIAKWTANSWNVSVYNQPIICGMADAQSLFIQHLKQEGQILVDDSGFLGSVLRKYTPKADYSAERNDALRQIANLPAQTGDYWRDLCVADIVYVLFRNAAILHLASAGEYCFDYDRLTLRITKMFALSHQERSSLLKLRGLKHGYRRREKDLSFERCISGARETISAIMMRIPDLTPSSIAKGNTTDTYYRRRLLELELVSHFDPLHLDALRANDELFDVWQHVRRTNDYPPPKVTPN